MTLPLLLLLSMLVDQAADSDLQVVELFRAEAPEELEAALVAPDDSMSVLGEGEWLAEGFSMTETRIDPWEYQERGSALTSSSGLLGCSAFFRHTEEGDRWRILLLAGGHLVVLDEGEEPLVMESSLGSSSSMITSQNGCFALLRGDDVCERFNIDEGTTDQLVIEGYPFIVGNSGRVIAKENTGQTLVWRIPCYYFYDENLVLTGSIYPGVSVYAAPSANADANLLAVAGSLSSTEWSQVDGMLTLFSSGGSELWSMPVPYGMPVVSSDGLSVAYRTGQTTSLIDARTGDVVAQAEQDDAMPLELSRALGRGLFYSVGTNTDFSINGLARALPEAFGGSSGLFLYTTEPGPYPVRMVLRDLSEGPIWVSAPMGRGDICTRDEHFTAAVDTSGLRFIVSDADAIRIIQLKRDE